MRVILLKDIPQLGSRAEVREVAPGYAVNFLFPRGLAEPATKKKIKALKLAQKQRTEEAGIQQELLKKNLAALAGKTVTLAANANEQGHLFKGVHETDVLAAIGEQLGCSLPSGALSLPEAIKKVGVYPLTISVGEERADFTLSVSAL